MSRKLRIVIGGIPFVAELLEEEAPRTCEAFLAALPIEGRVIQARWSGEAVWFPMDDLGIDVEQENATCHPSRGDLLYYPGGESEREMLIPYGSAIFSSKVGLLRGNHFATVVEGGDMLGEMGRRAQWEGAQEIVIEEA
jgi:hypothetical protein